MNVYDSDVEQSTETGVWDNNDHIAYKKDNPYGISAYIEDLDMFGGPDESGGFVGEIRIYFGTDDDKLLASDPDIIKYKPDADYLANDKILHNGKLYMVLQNWHSPALTGTNELTDEEFDAYVTSGDLAFLTTESQPKDSWMIKEMRASTIPDDLKGLTPRYPMHLTCVVSNKDKETGAYIGKQATIPSMWFEVVNYPSKLCDEFKEDLFGLYSKRIGELVDNILRYVSNQDPSVQQYMSQYVQDLKDAQGQYEAYYKAEQLKIADLDKAREDLERAKRTGDDQVIKDAQDAYDDAKDDADTAHQNTEQTFSALKDAADALRDNYPQTNRDEVASLVDPLDTLIDNGVWSLGKLGEDLNPAEAIYDILTNDLWGCNYDRITDIDIYSLLNLGVTCEEEGLGVSLLINSESQAGKYIQQILNHVNGIMYDNPYTGKLTFKLIRGDYAVDELPVFNPSNCESLKFTRLDWSETTSATSVTFTFADDKYNDGQLLYQDVANKFITRSYKEASVDGKYFTTDTNANWLAQVSQLASGYPLSVVEFKTNRLAHDIGLGDPILITWLPYGIDKQVYRVTDIDYATLTSNAITVSAIEDIYGFASTKYAYAEVPEWTNPKKYATSIQYFNYIEMPFEWTKSLDTHVNVFAARPSIDDIYYVNYRYTGTEYAKRAQTNHWSMVAQLVYGTSEIYDEDNTGFEIEIIGSEARDLFDTKCQDIEDYPSVYTNKSTKNMMFIGDEILTYDKMIKLQNGHYTLTNVIHGVFDTLPKDHPAYSKVYFFDYYVSVDGKPVATEGNYADEQYEVRAGTQDEEEQFNINDIINFHTKRRSELPSPMANLMFSAERGTESDYRYNFPSSTIFAYDINFIYNLRNKFNQSENISVHTSVTDAEPEHTTQYYIKCSCNGEEFEFKYDAVVDVVDPQGNITKEYPTDITLYWNEFCEQMGNKLQRVSNVHLEIGSYNKEKDLYSFDKYEKDIIYHVPRIVGILMPSSSQNEATIVKQYADSIVTATHVEIPQSTYVESTTMTFEDAPLILIADSSTTNLSGITGQDGIRYIPSTRAYRIDGSNGDNDAIIHEIELKPEFVLQNDFTRADGVNRRYYRYRNGQWLETQLYGST